MLLRNAGWGGRKSCHERRRGALRERRRWELDDGDDGCVGEHYGVGGFDHLPEDDLLYGEGDGFLGKRIFHPPCWYCTYAIWATRSICRSMSEKMSRKVDCCCSTGGVKKLLGSKGELVGVIVGDHSRASNRPTRSNAN